MCISGPENRRGELPHPIQGQQDHLSGTDKKISVVAGKGIHNRGPVGEAIRGIAFSLMVIPAIIGGSIFSLVGSPFILASKALEACRVKNPLRRVADLIQSAAREVISMSVLLACLPVNLEKLDPIYCKKGETPILLVHGFLGSSSHWLSVRKALTEGANGRTNVFTVNLGDPRLSIDDYTEVVRNKVEEIKAKTGSSEVILIGHSMGGLVCKRFAQTDPNSVRKIITIGSPLRGTQIARLGVLFSRSARDMIPKSTFLSGLETTKPITKIASSIDEIVIPNSSAQGTDGGDVIVDDAGHAGLLFSRKVIRAIQASLIQSSDP